MSASKLKIDLTLQNDWLKSGQKPFVIAGPCSAESEEQVLAAAQALDKLPLVRVFRAGIWKPRTRPNSFEGVGVKGLRWLQRVKQETRLLTAVEVANAGHVQAALKFGVDVLWVGARTTANPFSVQEIADALSGVDVPVLVKNPVNPDVQLWVGALERLNNAGIWRLGAIHRGFTTHEKSAYRNEPRWQIAIELKRLIPAIPLICDPSHIAGKSELLHEVSQKALDLTMDGLMIEAHPDPAAALSDADQQIRPAALRQLLDCLQIRNVNGVAREEDDLLAKLRRQSNAIDYEILELLARRMEVVKQIGHYKKAHNMTILQVRRWKEVVEDRLEKGASLGLDDDFVKTVYDALHAYAIKIQSGVMND